MTFVLIGSHVNDSIDPMKITPIQCDRITNLVSSSARPHGL